MIQFKVLYTSDNKLLCSNCKHRVCHAHISPSIKKNKKSPWFCDDCKHTNPYYLATHYPKLKRNICIYTDLVINGKSVKEVSKIYEIISQVAESGKWAIEKLLIKGVKLQDLIHAIKENEKEEIITI